MAIVIAKSDFIYNANNVYINLRENENFFYQEANVINYVKCALLRNDELNDFNVNGIDVYVYLCNDGYELHFNNHLINIEVYDKQIIDFDVLQYNIHY